jgi:arylamine N-acetyltransferase
VASRVATVDRAGVLRFLGLAREEPSLDYLRRLQLAFKHHVPWESASRIVRAAAVAQQQDRPRRPAEFWQRAMIDGTGGTCFESDNAFGALLRALGYAVEFRINDMPDENEVACHAAVVITLDGERYLSDVGLGSPIECPLPLDIEGERVVEGATERYRLRPESADTIDLRREGARDEQENAPMYLLVDRPVSDEAYDARVVEDYGEGGLFLDAVRLTRWFRDGTALRYSPGRGLIERSDRRWRNRAWRSDDHVRELAGLFGMPHAVVGRAFAEIGATP